MLLPLGLVAGVAGGCTSADIGSIDYRVTGGFSGGGDGTALHVEPDGTATKQSEGVTRTVQLDPQVMADLYSKVRAADFPSLAPAYECSCADVYIYEITVEVDGEDRKVSAWMQAQVPERLSTLITSLRQLAKLD
jgi:hypothetical protein